MKYPRKSALVLALAFVLGAIAASPLAAQSTWVVSSKGEIDARIAAQLDQLAREHHARIKFSTAEETQPSHRVRRGVLNIELVQIPSPEDFSKNLKTFAGPSVSAVTPELAREGYLLKARATYPSGPHLIEITAATPEGFHYALLRLPGLLRPRAIEKPNAVQPPAKATAIESKGKATGLTLADFPSFPQRGIVEGFYGKPWSHRDRLDMLRFEGEHRMNVYYYAPKDDPYHRKLWDEPYPADRLKELGELVNAARENFVDFCFAVSPGLSMTYSSDADFQKLTAKLDSVSRLGVSCFALFLDDVPQQLENPADVGRYKTLAAAHVDVINRLYRNLKAQSSANRLVVTPTVYTNAWGSRDYVRDLGGGVNPDVPIVWTGTDVVSPAITAAEAGQWGALLQRKPLIWDNFPVNDFVRWRPILGPLRGRAPDLPAAVQGYFCNPMIQAQASKIPLQTVAEYLWNAAEYDPDAAYRRALVDQYGPAAPRQLKAFLETYGDYGWDENIFQALFTERRTTFDTAKMRRRIALLERSLHALRANHRYRTLARELAPFPLKTRKRLPEVLKDPAFEHLPGGKLRWRDDYDLLQAEHLAAPPALDGDFSKWQSGKVYTLDSRDQISTGRTLWRSAGQFAARFALGWDESHLYLGVDVTDPELYQPFRGRDIAHGDFVSIMLETAFGKNYFATYAGVDEYSLLFSPGNFQDVAPDVYSQEDYLPPRPVPHDYPREVRCVWRKTSDGYSGDIALPASWFLGGKFSEGTQVGMVFSAQKAFAPPVTAAPEGYTNTKRMVFRSKADRTFPVRFGNPATYQRLVLEGAARGN
jgi:beta-N-acetylglucosaminidase